MEEVVAEQGYPVDRDRDEGCQGERLVQCPGIAAESFAGPAWPAISSPAPTEALERTSAAIPRRGW